MSFSVNCAGRAIARQSRRHCPIDRAMSLINNREIQKSLPEPSRNPPPEAMDDRHVGPKSLDAGMQKKIAIDASEYKCNA
jgi:hypothetical protein